MPEAAAVIDQIQDYHIHVYYDHASKPKAVRRRLSIHCSLRPAGNHEAGLTRRQVVRHTNTMIPHRKSGAS